MRTGQEAVLDLTLVKSRLGGIINWKVLRKCTIGSDHFPVLIEMCMNNCVERSERREGRWNYEKANWTEYVKRVEEGLDINEVRSVDDIEAINEKIIGVMKNAAVSNIPKSKGRRKTKMVPWWNKECDEATRRKRRAYKKVRRMHNYTDLIEYKREQAKVKEVVRRAKRQHWRDLCDRIGRSTSIGEV